MNSSTEEKLLAGISLLFVGSFGLISSCTVSIVLYRLAKTLTGFRVLFSESIAHTLLVVQYGIWPGFLILFGKDPLHKFRWGINLYIDTTAFVVYHHLTLVAFIRFMGIKAPYWLLAPSTRLTADVASVSCWLLGVAVAVFYQFSPWFSLVYYEPSQFGYDSENFGHTAPFWQSYNVATLTVPVFFYGLAAWAHIKHNNIINDSAVNVSQNEYKIERRLFIICAVRTFVFTMATFNYINHRTHWHKWLAMMSLLLRSIAFPVLLVTMSTKVKEEVKSIFGL